MLQSQRVASCEENQFHGNFSHDSPIALRSSISLSIWLRLTLQPSERKVITLQQRLRLFQGVRICGIQPVQLVLCQQASVNQLAAVRDNSNVLKADKGLTTRQEFGLLVDGNHHVFDTHAKGAVFLVAGLVGQDVSFG